MSGPLRGREAAIFHPPYSRIRGGRKASQRPQGRLASRDQKLAVTRAQTLRPRMSYRVGMKGWNPG